MHFYNDDCNRVLTEQVLPRFTYESYRKALCILDPYGLTLDWRTVEMAGKLRTVEVFVNFPIMDINRNCKRERLEQISPEHQRRMDAFWGDRSWHDVMFSPSRQMGLEGFDMLEKDKQSNERLAEAYRTRLGSVAQFAYVPSPMPMRNSKGAILYYLFFASPKETADKIVSDIFAQYHNYTPH